MLVTVVLLHFSFPLGDGMPKSSKHLQIKANANTKKQVKHAMRYTQYRGLAQVTNWVKLKFAAMNLKKLATWKWNGRHPAPDGGKRSRLHENAPDISLLFPPVFLFSNRTPALA